MSGLPIQPAWKEEAEKRLKARHVNVEEYPSKTFRREFFVTIGHVYWERLIVSTERGQADYRRLADHLGLERTTVWRWKNKTTPPPADKFFAVVLLVLKRDLRDLDLGSQNEILFDSVRRQCEALAAEYDEPTDCELTRFVFKSLVRVMNVPAVDDLAPGREVSGARRKEALREVHSELTAAIGRDFDARAERSPNFTGRPRAVKPSELDEWLAGWGIPYTLFAMGCTRHWGIEHV